MKLIKNYNIETSKYVLIEYGDGTDEFSSNKKGVHINFSDYATKILFDIE